MTCTKIYNARAQPLFCSLNLFFNETCLALTCDRGWAKKVKEETFPDESSCSFCFIVLFRA